MPTTTTPPRRTQQERRAEAEQRLIGAAAELISEGGPASLTLAKVGERAGYSSGLAAHYFGSKGALIERVAGAVSRQFGEAMIEAVDPHDSLLDETRSLVNVYFDIITNPLPINRARVALIADAVAHHDAEGRRVMVDFSREFRSLLSARFARAVDAGELDPDVDTDALAALVVGLLRGITNESVLDPTIDLRACRAEVDALLTARLQPRARARPS